MVVNLWHACQSRLFVITESIKRFTITGTKYLTKADFVSIFKKMQVAEAIFKIGVLMTRLSSYDSEVHEIECSH